MELNELFLSIEDGRRKRGQRYPLHSFLWMLFLSICSGHNTSRTISKFMKAHSAFFIEEFNLKHGLPSHVTVNHILNVTDKEGIKNAFNQWFSSRDLSRYDWISGDGQSLCSTVVSAQGPAQDLISVVSWFAQKTGTVFLMEDYRSKKGDEGEVIRQMLSILKDKGLIITLDALHAQKKLQKKSSDPAIIIYSK